MPRRPALIVAAAASLLLVAGCSQQLGDRSNGAGRDPDRLSDVDYVEVYRNIDNFPNVAKVCAGGLAFATTSSRDGQTSPALVRVPEWDRTCPAGAAAAPSPTATPSG